jgi:Tol biopolymer transport system component
LAGWKGEHGIIHLMGKHRGSVVILLAGLVASSYGTARQQSTDGSSSWHIKKIAFVEGYIPHTAIFVVDPLGSKPRQLVEGEAPSWSPDGERMAYCVRMGPRGFGQIQVINADGSGRKQLTSVKGGGCEPDWSPDGEKIAFRADCGISIVDKNGGSSRCIADGASPRWSPESQRLVFARYAKKRGERNSIWVINADGTGLKKVLEVDSEVVEATWLPDGMSIAFPSRREHELPSIFRVNLDGTGLESVAADKKYSLYFPVFSPDGKQLVVDAIAGKDDGVSILQVDLGTREAKLLARGRHPTVIWEKR